METYNVDQAFEILKENKITTQKESVRRWLRDGKIKAEAPTSKKAGWKIPKSSLDAFIKERLPDSLVVVQASIYDYDNTTNDVIADTVPDDKDYLPDDLAAVMGISSDTSNDAIKKAKEEARIEMWWELIDSEYAKVMVIKKGMVKACIEHRRYSKEIFDTVWDRCLKNNKDYYKQPKVVYIGDAFLFEGERLLFDDNFEDRQEQLIFPLIEHVWLKFMHGVYK